MNHVSNYYVSFSVKDETSHTAAVCRRTDTGHTANGGHVTKFQGGDTNGMSSCTREKKPQFYCPLLLC